MERGRPMTNPDTSALPVHPAVTAAVDAARSGDLLGLHALVDWRLPLGRQLAIDLRPAAAEPSRHAENARQAALLGTFHPTRDRPRAPHPDMVRPGGAPVRD
jgi:hypothetical protein